MALKENIRDKIRRIKVGLSWFSSPPQGVPSRQQRRMGALGMAPVQVRLQRHHPEVMPSVEARAANRMAHGSEVRCVKVHPFHGYFVFCDLMHQKLVYSEKSCRDFGHILVTCHLSLVSFVSAPSTFQGSHGIDIVSSK